MSVSKSEEISANIPVLTDNGLAARKSASSHNLSTTTFAQKSFKMLSRQR